MKRLGCVILAAVSLTLGSAAHARAGPPSHGRAPASHLQMAGGHGGGHHGGRSGRFHGHHRGVVVGNAFIGAPFFWDPFWDDPFLYVPPPSRPVIIDRGPQVYMQQPGSNYWYYCADAGAYYPYVHLCPKGWTKVVPPGNK